MSGLSLLGVFAHPDDEQLVTGTFARAAAEGIPTGIICATRGEEGEIHDPYATPETLGKIRENELRAASAVAGIKHIWFLDYRDSGMDGTPQNGNPEAFIRSNQEEALGKIVKIVRDYKPAVLVTFEPMGGYGHPDHITISRLTLLAYTAAADASMYPEAGEPWQVKRVFFAAFPRALMRRFGEYMAANNIQSGLGNIDPDKYGLSDEQITNTIDVHDLIEMKAKSLGQHRTQMDPNSPFARLPVEITREMRGKEHFSLAAGVPLPPGAEARGDLLAGLREGLTGTN